MTMPSGESTVGTMDGRAVARSVSRAWRSPVGDVAPALLLLVLVVAADYRAPFPQLILEAAFVVPLVLRRRAPLLMVAAMSVPMALGSSVSGWAPDSPSFGALAGLLLTMYSVGAHERALPRSLAGAAVLVVVSNLDLAIHGLGKDDFWPFRFLFLGGAWLTGRALFGRGVQLERAEVEAERLARDQEARARAAVADERARLARELHDLIAHNVAVMVVQAGAAEEVLRSSPDRAAGPLRQIQESGRQTISELRRLLGILRADADEPMTAPQPSLARLDALVERVRAAGLPVEVVVDGVPRPLPASLDMSAYRIIQEGLTNTLKHAGPARARVGIHHRPDSLELEVEDDGHRAGRDGEPGQGLVGIRERVALFGGRVETGPAPHGGFLLRVVLPLDSA